MENLLSRWVGEVLSHIVLIIIIHTKHNNMNEIDDIFAGYKRLCCQNFEKIRGEDSWPSEYLNFVVSYFELNSVLFSTILCSTFVGYINERSFFFSFLDLLGFNMSVSLCRF